MKHSLPTSRCRDLGDLGKEPKPWTHIAPRGEFPGLIQIPAGYDVPGYGVAAEPMEMDGVTVFDDRTLESMVQRFDADVLIDQDHLSHDQDKSTEAMGWGRGLRYTAGRDGLELETSWTPPGREKISTQVYRYISPEFSGSVRYEGGVFKFYPSALTGAGLTNRPKLKALRPVSANRTNTDPTKPTMKSHALTLLCSLLAMPETATEQELTDRATAFGTDLATSKNRAKQADALEAEVKQLRDEAIERDLETFAPVIEDKEAARELLQMNREAARKSFTAQLAKFGGGASNVTPIYQKNRATAPDGAKFAAATEDEAEAKADQAAAYVAIVRNREKCGFQQAWDIARGEKPELFA